MCDAVSAIAAAVSTIASIGSSAYQGHQQRKAAREQKQIQEQTERRQKALLTAKGADQVSRNDRTAADNERRRRTAVMSNNSVLTSRQGALGTPNTANIALSGQNASRSTLG